MPTKRKTAKKATKSRAKKRQHPKHFLKVYWPYIPVLVAVTFGMLFGGVYPNSNNRPATLAYSTEMSRSVLLSGTNTQRANNGVGALTINSKLNTSAQAKANDMIARDYWAHNTPDGNEPWVFFDAAGYSYTKAGENLAYGFATSNDTIIGWMNSPSHKANLLDPKFTEVGFGFANSPNFVGTGQETIVVAHYAEPAYTPPTPAPAPVSTPSSTPTAPAPQALPAETVQEPQAPEESQAPSETKPELAPLSSDKINQPFNSDTPQGEEPDSKNITLLQRWTNGEAPWSAIALSVMAFSIVIIWLIKHAVLVKRFLFEGEHFVAHHPALDLIVVVIAAVSVYLSQAAGVVI